jgi:hypothetical protein
VTSAQTSNIDEVNAHALYQGAISGATAAQTSNIDEVAAHAVQQGVTNVVSMRVIFDEEQEIYIIE